MANKEGGESPMARVPDAVKREVFNQFNRPNRLVYQIAHAKRKDYPSVAKLQRRRTGKK